MEQKKVMELEMEGVSVYVMVDSKQAQVYQAETVSTEPKGTKGYIESVEGKRFSIQLKARPGLSRHALLLIDGERVACGTIRSDRDASLNYWGKWDSPTTLRPFIFAPIQLTDDTDVATTSEQIVKNMGVIKLVILRVVAKPKKKGKRNPPATYTYTAEANKVLHEQSKKATLSHVAGLGAPVSVAPIIADEQYIRVDSETNPWVTFEFKYLSRDLLEIQNIIPMQDIALVAEPASVKVEGKKRAATSVITIDSEDDETPEQELARLRKENIAMKKIKLEPRVKVEGKLEHEREPKEENGKAEKPSIILIDD